MPIGKTARRDEWDALRGLMLVLMTLTHFPSQFSDPLGQPFGFVSSAEGFVLLSAFLVGSIATSVAARAGIERACSWLWRRALKVYAAHVLLLVLLFAVLLPYAADQAYSPIVNLSSYYLAQPVRGAAEALALAYNPPLLDILPLYVLFLAATPMLLALARRFQWSPVLAASVMVWFVAQFDAGRYAYQWVAQAIGWSEPYSATGAFVLLAWQMLWVLGVYAGSRAAQARDDPRAASVVPPKVARAAIGVALVFFAWRHAIGQMPFGDGHGELNAWFDKWHLAPLRLLDFAALVIVFRQFASTLVRQQWLVRPLAFLGRASLPVFSAQLVICMAALAYLGDGPRPWAEDALLLAGAFMLMALVAWAAQAYGRLAPARDGVSARVAR